jgi:hypothetical protein
MSMELGRSIAIDGPRGVVLERGGEENGKGVAGFVARADDSVTFGWFVSEKYIPMRCGRWRPVTKQKTEFEIDKYLVEKFKGVPIRDVGLFGLQRSILTNLPRGIRNRL